VRSQECVIPQPLLPQSSIRSQDRSLPPNALACRDPRSRRGRIADPVAQAAASVSDRREGHLSIRPADIRESGRPTLADVRALGQWPAIWPPSMCRISPVMNGDDSKRKGCVDNVGDLANAPARVETSEPVVWFRRMLRRLDDAR
jgi:hypothetical protein